MSVLFCRLWSDLLDHCCVDRNASHCNFYDSDDDECRSLVRTLAFIGSHYFAVAFKLNPLILTIHWSGKVQQKGEKKKRIRKKKRSRREKGEADLADLSCVMCVTCVTCVAG